MEFSKKLNLLPQSYKDKYTNRYIMLGVSVISVILLLIIGITFLNYGITKLGIKKLTEENIEFQTKQSTIVGLEKEIEKNKAVVSEYEKDDFPFYYFIQTIENQKPQGLKIISIDSADRLISAQPKTDEKDADAQQKSDGKNDNTESDKAETDNNTATEEKKEQPISRVTYEKDLSGMKLSIRSYSTNTTNIAEFISAIARLPYIADAELKAIEEHTVNGVDKANIFEVILTLK